MSILLTGCAIMPLVLAQTWVLPPAVLHELAPSDIAFPMPRYKPAEVLAGSRTAITVPAATAKALTKPSRSASVAPRPMSEWRRAFIAKYGHQPPVRPK